VDIVVILQVSYMVGNLLTSWMTISFPQRTVLSLLGKGKVVPVHAIKAHEGMEV
jgi:hypothetical protein